MASDIERYKKFGNNYFKLVKPNCQEGKELTGVLLELPSFGFSTKWEESPAASMGEELYKLVNKPEIEFLASTVEGANVMRRTGNLTSKVYESAEPVSFELKFRCYPGQSFGDDDELSKAEDWIDTLKNTTTISTNTGISADKVITNLTQAGKGIGNQIFGIVDDVKNMINGKDDKATLMDKLNEIKKLIDIENEKTFNAQHISSGSKLRDLEKERKQIEARLRENKGEIDKKMKLLTKKYEDRVNTSVDNFGSSLFNLILYPFIFKKPLIVYISSWSAKPSKEYNLKESASFYYDFTISCTMDRVLSAKTWDTYYLT